MKKMILIGAGIGVAITIGVARWFWNASPMTLPSWPMARGTASHATSSTLPDVPVLEMASSVRAALEVEGWTVTVDRAPSGDQPVAGDVPGTIRVREFIASRGDSTISPIITRFRVADPSAFIREAAAFDGQRKTIGQRNGYLLNIPGQVPNDAFVLIGKTSLYFIQFGLRDAGNAIPWGVHDPAPELARLIQRLPLE